jgi:hypothetical protein
VSRIESSSGGEMPALLKAMSTLPKVLVGSREHRVDGLLLVDVAADIEDAELVGQRCTGLVVEVGDHDLGTLLRRIAARSPGRCPSSLR